MNKVLLSLLISCYGYVSEAQIIKQADTIYYRYDNSIGTVKLSNYYSVRTLLDDGSFDVREYYRFTRPHKLKAIYKENIIGLKQGAYAYYAKDNFIEEEGVYTNDEKEGEIIYYEKGQIQRKVPYKKGKQDGIASYFHEGEKLYEWTWKNGKSDGYNESTYDDGSIRFKGTYVNAKLIGKSYSYFDNDTLKTVYSYKNGKLDGVSQEFHKNGSQFSEGSYKDGKVVGTWKWYREDGSLASEENYTGSGRLKELTFYDADGNKIKSRKKDKLIGAATNKKELHKIIQKYMSNSFSYPDIMYDSGYEGTVFMSFKIDKNGEVIDVKAKSSTHISFEIEAENLLKALPKQKSTFVHNVPFDLSFSMPLTFRF